MSVESTRQVVTRYINSNHSDTSMMAEDVVFKHMASGEEYHGVKEVQNMLNYTYHIVFNAHAEKKNMIFSDKQAVLEADFIGKHVGEFAGIPATNKDVRVPLCVIYDLEDDKIKKARIYFELPAMIEQIK